MARYEKQFVNPNFWQDPKNKDLIKDYRNIKNEIDEFDKINDLLKKIDDAGEEALDLLEEKIHFLKLKTFLKGKYDDSNAFFSIYAGAGGKDAEDWAAILLRMYESYFKKKGFKSQILDKNYGEGGIKSVTLKVEDSFVFGWLKNEIGVHRLVRISPFSKDKLRHTSFALVDVVPEIKDQDFKINDDEIKIETSCSSGPGGQYTNKRETRVKIIHLPTKISVSCQQARTQGENKKLALEMLKSKLLLLNEEEKEKAISSEKSKVKIPTWSNQIRSYIFEPYKLVKDHRTGYETNNLDEVLNGNLDEFIIKEIEMSK